MPGRRRKEIEMLLPIYLSAVDEMNLKNRFQLVVPTTKKPVGMGCEFSLSKSPAIC